MKYLDVYQVDLKMGHLKEAVRYYTFSVLKIQHTCHHGDYTLSPYSTWGDDGDDDEPLEENHDGMLDLLESLINEFEAKMDEISESSGFNSVSMMDFWKDYWLVRMQQETKKLRGKDITDEERRSAQELGVVWHDRVEDSESESNTDLCSYEYLRACIEEIGRE